MVIKIGPTPIKHEYNCLRSMDFSAKDKHIVVNYHYIRNPHKDFSGIYPCAIKRFEQHMDFLSKNFRFASLEETFSAAQSLSKEKLCSITFDDGTKDQFLNAVPILNNYGAKATFFIITGTLKGIMPFTHKIHILLSRISPHDPLSFFEDFVQLFSLRNKSQYKIQTNKFISKDRELMGEDVRVANFKDALIALDIESKNLFLDYAFNKLRIDINALAKEFFMGEKELRELDRQGFSIGSHTYGHNDLDSLTRLEIQTEINISKEHLEQILGKPPVFFCYPFGRIGKNYDIAAGILQEEGFTHAVTIERRSVTHFDSPFFIPRYDTNDIRDFLNQK